MKLDTEKIDRVVLALLHLGLHDDFRAWKSFAWEPWIDCIKKASLPIPSAKQNRLPLANPVCGNLNVCLPSCLPRQMEKDRELMTVLTLVLKLAISSNKNCQFKS